MLTPNKTFGNQAFNSIFIRIFHLCDPFIFQFETFMNRIKALTLLMVLMCSGVHTYSQKHIGNYDQLLLTGTQTPVENFDLFLDDPKMERDEIVLGHCYRLVQFFEVPTELEKRAVLDAGIQLFDYVPHRTFVAAIPGDFSKEKIRELNIRNISKLQPHQKIAPTILNDDKLVLEYYPNLSADFVKDFLQNKNIEIHEIFEAINSMVISKTDDLETIANFPITFFLSAADGDFLPEYIPSKNLHRSNCLTPRLDIFPQFNGEGVDIAIGDDGVIESHIDFKNRTVQTEVLGDYEGSHGEMVAGILAGAGNLDPRMEGTATHAQLHVFNEFDAVKKADILYNDRNIVITSTSYSDGCNRGYTYLAQLADHQARSNHSLTHVFSAGNTGEENCGYGAGNGWGNITGGVKMGKNVITVANVDADDRRPNTSSRGPAGDGRIKPDLAANGEGIFSTQPNNTYAITNGSSAAAPGVTGVIAQLYQAYAISHNNMPPNSALIKAAILNTADDVGNPGPDFSYGYGRINARRAFNVINNNQYFEDVLGHTNVHAHFIQVPPATQQLRVMLYWHDYQGSTITTPALVNDLDLKVINADGESYYPWILNSTPDTSLLNLPATRGIDNVNNVEQVTIDFPQSGLYSFQIDGAIIAQGSQPYFLVYELVKNNITITYPLGGEKLVPGEWERIHWDAFGNQGNFELDISFNNGNSWEVLGLATGDKRSFLWQVPTTVCNQTKIRIKRANEVGESLAAFSIYDVPQDLHVAEVCPDMVRLEWEEMANAQSYIIYRLGEKFMEVYATTDLPSVEIPIDDPSIENWYAVAAVGDNGLESRRSTAINDGMGLLNCDLTTDVSIHSIASPANAVMQSCYNNPITVSINITNTGSSVQSNIPVFYQFDNQTVVSEIYSSSLPPGITINYVFNQKIPASDIGTHQLKVWTAQPNDQATFNDEMEFQLEIVSGTSATLPYFQNFDDFENCDVEAACDLPCLLSAGWYNDPNYQSDDSDWLVHQGATPTTDTGPIQDQNTNSSLGKYLYLEGSRGCTNQDAYLLSPCFDLTSATKPTLSFWYHMKGIHTGRLHIDLFDGANWFYNILPTLTGEQGDDWKEAVIDLTAFINKTINIRFRGLTGQDYLTDIAIDNVALFDANTPPYPNFKADNLSTCPGQAVQFVDNSINTPTGWEWKFAPNTVSFVNGTTASQKNPMVVFNEEGNYDVTLITTNAYGTTQINKTAYLEISHGDNIPFGDHFTMPNINLEKWKIHNGDNSTTWATTNTTGRDGQPTQAIFMNNHSYNAVGEKDELQSVVIDLSEAQQPFLRFDWAYAQFSSNFADGLQVLLSTDCGENYDAVIFDKHGDELATVEDHISGWFPQKSYEWKTAEIDLSDYIGSSVAIKFISVNGFGNNLFVDNFLVYEYESFPRSVFFFYPEENTFCVGEEAVTFITNVATDQEFFWNFGASATPSSSPTYGPHVVTFDYPGTYHISFKVKNSLGYDMAESVIHVIDVPIADFDYSLDNKKATFTNHSSYGNTYLWEFGDGTTSTLENPTHEYAPGSTYTARLTVTNKCGESSTHQTLIITTSTDDLENNFFIDAYPNPTNDFILFEMPALNQISIPFDVIDARGVVISSFDLKEENGLFTYQLNASQLSQGMYFARAQVGEHTFVKRFVKIL
ncbi:MAG: S8 family serine peptidase [Bacteroidota bacterium]